MKESEKNTLESIIHSSMARSCLDTQAWNSKIASRSIYSVCCLHCDWSNSRYVSMQFVYLVESAILLRKLLRQ
jgi:hypothetical protein